ncbi:MAG: efflux RND transporter periplasmic adaptor subunit [Pseudomonadota bacterium]
MTGSGLRPTRGYLCRAWTRWIILTRGRGARTYADRQPSSDINPRRKGASSHAKKRSGSRCGGSILPRSGVLRREGTTPEIGRSARVEARLEAARAALGEQQARLQTANANLSRVKPLAAQNAVSQKDLDDALGQQQAAAAAVEAAKADVINAELNLGYCTIRSPVSGLSSFAQVQEGTYVNFQNSLLTSVSALSPMRVNFSVSENQILRNRDEQAAGSLRIPADRQFQVEVILADGSTFDETGRITFADAEFSESTGTFLIRAEFRNARDLLRPGQFVRVKLLGATRPDAILVPKRAVRQGAQGSFVWVVNKEGKAEFRPVLTGDWIGDDWIITQGLRAGETVAVDGAIKLRAEAPVKVSGPPASAMATATAKPAAAGGAGPGEDSKAAPGAGSAAAAGGGSPTAPAGAAASPAALEARAAVYFALASAELTLNAREIVAGAR